MEQDKLDQIYMPKARAVEALCDVVCDYQGSIDDIKYELYEYPSDWVEEFLVITYIGGSKRIIPIRGQHFRDIYLSIGSSMEIGTTNVPDVYKQAVDRAQKLI